MLDRVALDREFVRRGGLYAFGTLAWPVLFPGHDLVHNWHISELARHIEACFFGDLPRMLVNIPPGTGKSVWCSVLAPAWAWTKDPTFSSICGSFDDQLTQRDAARVVALVSSSWYRARWPVTKLARANPRLDEFYTTSGGMRYSTSVHGRVTGHHANVLQFDDPIKPAETMGSALTTKCELTYVQESWWKGSMTTRILPGQPMRYLGVMQRLHEEDLVGYLQRNDNPVTLRLPMRFQAANRCVTPIGGDQRTVDGELLFPAMFPENRVRELERDLGIFAHAQLQQEPTNPEGEVFKAGWLRQRWTTLPRMVQVILSGDMSFKKAAGCDRCSLQVWGTDGRRLYLLDNLTSLMSFQDTVRAIRHLQAKWSDIGAILIEDTANGPAVIETLQQDTRGVIAVKPEGGKVSRANAVTYLFQAGDVLLPQDDHAPWVLDYVAEMLRFTGRPGVKDDQVDATTQALGWLAKNSSAMWNYLETLDDSGANVLPIDRWGDVCL